MKLKVGQVLKAQGIKGEVKAACFLDDAAMLKNVKQLYVGGVAHQVAKLRADRQFFFVQFVDVTDRNTAETLRNAEIFCDKQSLQPGVGRYFVADILGCNVVLDDGSAVGTICEVLQYGAADVYVCKQANKEISFPALKDLLLSVDTEAKQIVLSAKRFAEVSVSDED